MHEELPCTLITWDEVYRLCRQLVRQLRKANFRVDIIVAIARGGYVPGRLLSDMLGVHDLTSFKVEHYQGIFKQHAAYVKYPLSHAINGRNVLLLGNSFNAALTLDIPALTDTRSIQHSPALKSLDRSWLR